MDFPTFQPASPGGPQPQPPAPDEPSPEVRRKRAVLLFLVVLVGGAAIFAAALKHDKTRKATLKDETRTGDKVSGQAEEARAALDAKETARLTAELNQARGLIQQARAQRLSERDLAALDSSLANVERLIAAKQFEEADRILDEVRLSVPTAPISSTPPRRAETAPAETAPAASPARRPARRKTPKKKRRRAGAAPVLARPA